MNKKQTPSRSSAFRLIKKRGFSIVQVLIASAVVAGLALVVVQIAKTLNSSTQKTRDVSTVASLKNLSSTISQDLQSWLKVMRNNSLTSPLMNCMPISLSGFDCPSADSPPITDPQVTNALPTATVITSVAIVTPTGQQIAGPVSAPQYFDNNGGSCTGTNCRYRAIGYFLRETTDAHSDPGKTAFVIKYERNPTQTSKGELVLAPTYDTIIVNREWTETMPDCSSGYVAPSASGTKICYSVAACPQPPVVAVPQMFVGWNTSGPNAGQAICVNVPIPYQGDCPAGQVVTGFKADGTRTCQ